MSANAIAIITVLKNWKNSPPRVQCLRKSTLYSPSVIQYICFLNPLEKRNCPLAWPSMMCEILRTSNMHLNWIEYHHRDSACSPVISSPRQLWSIFHLRHLVCNHNSMQKAYITRHHGNFHDFRQHSRLKTNHPGLKIWLSHNKEKMSVSLWEHTFCQVLKQILHL